MITNKANSKTGYYSAASGKVLFAPRMALGMNLGKPGYYEPTQPFINLLYTGGISVVSGAPTLTTDGWYDCTSGGSAKIHFEQKTATVKDGVWILKWGNATGTVSASVTGSNTTSTSSGRHEITVSGGAGLGFNVTYSGGLPSYMALIHSDDEALYDSGQIINPLFLADIEDYSVLRFLDWNEANNSPLYGDEYSAYYLKESAPAWEAHDAIPSPGFPAAAIADCCNLSGADCWVTVPHKLSYTSKVAMAQDLFDHLDPSINVYPETGNENWNTAGVFRDCTSWFDYADAPTRDVTVDSLASVNEVAHGMSTGDEVVTYTCIGGQGKYVYKQGYTLSVIVDDADNYRIARDATAALAGEDVLTTPNAKGAWDTAKTRLLLKRKLDSSKSNAVNYAEACIETWDAFISVFGASRVVQVATGWIYGSDDTTEKCTVAEFKDRCDLFAVGGYYNFGGMADYVNATNAERSAFLRANNSVASTKSHAPAFGRNIIGIYEGSNHNTTSTDGSAEDLALQDYARSAEHAQDLKWWLEEQAKVNCKLFCLFNSHSEYTNDGCWGLQEVVNEVNNQTQVIQDFIINGGVDNG
jgi:hypothetical protein